MFAVGLADSGQNSVTGSYLEGTSSLDYLSEDMNAICLWKLSLDDENNSSLRDEFFYEQVRSPSEQYCESVDSNRKVNDKTVARG